MSTIVQKGTIGIILITGSLAFMMAALMPVSRVFAERVAEQRLAIIEVERSGWNVAQFFFALGSIIAWAGMGLLAIRINISNGSVIGLGTVAAAGIGLIFWLGHVYLRTIRPEDFANNLLPGWHFPLYGFLTLLALFGIGVGMLSMKFPGWLPVFNMSSGVLLAIAFLIFKDVPPFFFYLITLVDGIALLILRPF